MKTWVALSPFYQTYVIIDCPNEKGRIFSCHKSFNTNVLNFIPIKTLVSDE